MASVAATPPAAVAELAARGRAAQRGWQALGFDGRGKVLRRARRWMSEHADDIAATIVSETGKTYEDALVVEVGYTANAFGFWARQAPRYLADEKVRTANPFVLGRSLRVRYAPFGLVGVIGPWNYPLVNSFGDAIPALAAGNAVLLKPASLTPLTSLRMAEAMAECGLPDGVLQVVPGGPPTGEALIDAVDMVMFTGATDTGRRVMERAARTLTPVSLELGGKDPMIVLADADLERAANAALYYSLQNGGQTCISIERVYVEAAVHDPFVAKLSEKIAALRHGPPGAPGSVEVGAVTSPGQLDIIAAHVEQARTAGANVLAGGRVRDGGGRFYAPTLVTGVDHTMDLMREETFGPVLPVMRVDDADEAVRLANDSPYGLSAAVWTGDRRRGAALARRLEAGAVCVNDASLHYLALELPMGGWKASGLGSRHGAAGIRKYTRTQSLLVTCWAPRRELHYFPYSAHRSRLMRRVIKALHARG